MLAVGRQRPGPLRELQSLYLKRIVPAPAIVELEEKRPLSPPELVAREGDLLLAALPAGARFIALDGGGQCWSSEELARRLAGWRQNGQDVAFAIGGADGLSRAVLGHANGILSIGAMTWPHLLVRVMLLEQLYRAQQILAGHPYHRE
ncbi:MAG TPA: 23S rRNA (pseudouridine(1915)-N(3))-methyltransferase RlmH [Stellaceae bacterium]|nr:23S rRNA (pseudouridine(1915)-N(3))-methyltransferase RlmH [Stellaceae bacterium]